ncbi:MAG: sulfur carrier protein ThiS [bacterium]|jgi:thiamine biosynthesis protein ThiS|nr:MAG: thiamine biosynthesis protein ThiS [bacterium]
MQATGDQIEITLNGEPRRVPAGLTVAGLLAELGLHPGLVVVEHNREILERARLAETPVEPGDVFEIVHFVGGGS